MQKAPPSGELDATNGSGLRGFRRPLGGAGCERSEQTEGVFPAVHGYDPTCENGVQKRPQAFLYPEI